MTIGTKVKYLNEHGKILGTGKVGAYDGNITFVITDGISNNGNYVEVVPNSLVIPLSELEFCYGQRTEMQDQIDKLRTSLRMLVAFSVNDATKSAFIHLVSEWIAQGGELPIDLVDMLADS